MRLAAPRAGATATRVRSPGVTHPDTPAGLDRESREWLRDLRSRGIAYDDAVARLHALLLGAARRCRTCAATTFPTSRCRRPTTR